MAEKNPYSDSYTKASENLRLVLAFLSKHKIPTSPMNYRMAYDYVTGLNSELNSDLDDLFKNTIGNLDNALWLIFRKHYIQDEETLEQMRIELRGLIEHIQEQMRKSGGDLGEYTKTLNHFSSVLDGAPGEDALSSEMNKVLQDTRKTEQSQKNLDSEMADLMTKVESLSKELQQVKQESLIDALTEISNRKAFDDTLEREVRTALETSKPLSILFADIDYFKSFNDTHGHLVGDKVLRFVGATLKQSIKGCDMAARYGGEEFAIVLPNTDLKGASCVAEQIRKRVSSGSLKDKASGSDYGRITISIGAAQLTADELPKELIKRADSALYMAKDNGRNRVEQAVT